ncbi:MAG: hypothetical protein WBP41_05295, partial [Saprospiraceae bacterium]
ILNGDFDHRVSKLVELAIIFGKVPILNFIDVEQYKSSAGGVSVNSAKKNQYPLKSSMKNTMVANDKIIMKEKAKGTKK